MSGYASQELNVKESGQAIGRNDLINPDCSIGKYRLLGDILKCLTLIATDDRWGWPSDSRIRRVKALRERLSLLFALLPRLTSSER